MRTSPADPDGASGLYVAAFQIGIMAGALIGGGIYDNWGIAAMIAAAAGLIVAALSGVLSSRGLFAVPWATSEK